MGSSHVLIMFPSCSRDPAFARLQTGKKPKPPMLKHASASQALAHRAAQKSCRHRMLQQGPINDDFNRTHVGRYGLAQALSKIHLPRQIGTDEKTDPTQLSHRIHTLFACTHTQTTRGRKSASHHPSVWPAPFFSGHLSPAQDHLCRLPGRGARSGGAAPRQPACLAGRPRPLPRGRVVAGARRPPPKRTLPGLGAGARPHGREPRPDTSDAPREPGTTLLSLHSAGRQGPQPPRALAELSPRAQGGEATRSPRKKERHLPYRQGCLPSSEVGGWSTNNASVSSNYVFSQEERQPRYGTSYSSHHVKKFPVATPRASAEKAPQSKI